MFCTPCGVASWPVTGIGRSLWFFSAVTTEPARLSLAAIAPSILLPFCASICSKIVRPFWAFESVVVDRLHALGLGRALDRRARTGVEGVHEDHLRPVGQTLVTLRALLLLVAERIEDAVRDAGRLERLGQVRLVEQLVAD